MAATTSATAAGSRRRVPGGPATRRRRGRPSRAVRRCRHGPRRAAASRGGRVSPCTSTRPARRARVPVGADLSGVRPSRRRPVPAVASERVPLPSVARGVPAGAEGGVRPAGDAGGVGQDRRAPVWPAPRGRGALGRPGCGAARAPLVHGSGAAARGRGRTSRSLESRGIRDVTGAVFPLTARKPKRNVTAGDGRCRRRGRRRRARTPSSASGRRPAGGRRARGAPGASHQGGEEAAQGLFVALRVGVPHGARAGRAGRCGGLTRSGRRAASRGRAPRGRGCRPGRGRSGSAPRSGLAGRRLPASRSPCSPVAALGGPDGERQQGAGVRRAAARARRVASQSRTGESRTRPLIRSRSAGVGGGVQGHGGAGGPAVQDDALGAVAHGVADGRVQVAPLGLAEVAEPVRGAGCAGVAAVGEVEHREAAACAGTP